MDCCGGELPEQRWDGGCIPLAWLGTPPCATHRSASPPGAALTQLPRSAGVNSSKDIDSREAAFGRAKGNKENRGKELPSSRVSRMLLSQLPFPLDEHHHPFHECLTTSLLPESFGNTQGSARAAPGARRDFSAIRGCFHSLLARLLGFGEWEGAPTQQSWTHWASLKAKGTKHEELHQLGMPKFCPTGAPQTSSGSSSSQPGRSWSSRIPAQQPRQQQSVAQCS